jgi:hypothetical protein
MGNYSYLKKVIFGKETKIDYEKLKEELNKIDEEKDMDAYLHCIIDDDITFNNNVVTLENFDDYAKRIHNHKLCGYLNRGTIKKLCKSGLCMTTENKQNPIMFFEEEGWDRLYYFKFFPGTEKVEMGTYAFDFDNDFYEKEYKSKTTCFKKADDLLDHSNVYDYYNDHDDIYEYINEKKENYIRNLIYDKSTNWNISILNYNVTERKPEMSIEMLMMLSGIRPEDMKKEPEKYKQILRDTWTK